MGAKLLPQSLKIKTLSYTIVMPSELQARLNKPGFPKGEGGWQTLVREMQSQMDGEKLELSQTLLNKMVPLATQYGAGGYQGLIRWVLCLLLAQHQGAVLGEPQSLKDQMKQGNGAAKEKAAPATLQGPVGLVEVFEKIGEMVNEGQGV